MKKLLIICILIVSIIFISGCASDEQASSDISTSSQSNQESDTQSTGSILKLSDVSGLNSEYYKFYSVPKNMLYVPSEYGISGPENMIHRGTNEYTDTLRVGYRNVGEESRWSDQSGKKVIISVVKFDSDPNSSLMESFTKEKEVWGQGSEKSDELYISDPHIGDYSYYLSYISPDTDLQEIKLKFIHGNTYALVMVEDEKGISEKTAIRIAKIIESRLD